MAGTRQKFVAAALFLSALAFTARADEPNGPIERVFEGLQMGPSTSLFASGSAAQGRASAGAIFRHNRNWSTRLFVSHVGSRPGFEDDAPRLRSSSTVGAQLTGRLTKTTRITFDVFNLFGQRMGDVDHFAGFRSWPQPGPLDNYLFHPAEPRGFRIRFTQTF